ncbi:MAG: hypothetical protein QOI38_2064 [Sphingomonadales bacterium]|nr:hypothetical protein [Sphingomonadales bacterium]
MIPPVILPVVRRAIVDLLFDVGGEHNDDTLTLLLAQLGHRVARRDVAEQLEWLANEAQLIRLEDLGPYKVARILADGRDVAEGRLLVEGVSRFKTGD